jgi:hypothetical protein
MLVAHLEGLGRRKPLLPATELRLEGSTLFVDGAQYGYLREGTWDCGSVSATAIPIDSEVQVRFEDEDQEAKDCGPFRSIRIADDSIYSENRLLARLDAHAQLWQLKRDGSKWPNVIIRRPAGV